MRKVLFLFSSLNDDDVEWLCSAGTLQRVPAGGVLIEQGGALDSLYIVVGGTFSVSVTGPPVDESAQRAPVEPRVVAYLQAGDIMGEMSFIDSHPPSGTVTAVEDSRVLAISRARLNERLLAGTFGLRFYRAIAVLLSHRLRAANARLRDGAVGPGREGTDTVSEVDPALIEAVSVAGARFTHLVRQLGV